MSTQTTRLPVPSQLLSLPAPRPALLESVTVLYFRGRQKLGSSYSKKILGMATAGGLLSGLTGNLSSVVVQPGGWVGDEGWNAAGARALGLEMEAKDGRAIIARIGHGSPAMLCGGIAVGDEVVSIDGFPVTPDLSLFARRAAAGVKDSLVQLTLRHSSSGDAENKHGEHDVVLLRAETIEPAPVLYTEATNDAIGPTSVAAAALVTPQAGLGIVVGVSVVADPSFVRDRKGMTELESTSQDVVIKDIPVGSAVWKHTCKLVCISILHAICMHIGLASLVFMCALCMCPITTTHPLSRPTGAHQRAIAGWGHD